MTANPSWFPHPTHPHRGILDHRYDDHRGHRWSTECVCGWRSPVEDCRGLAEAGHLLHIAFASGVTVGSRWTDSQAVTWTVLGFQQGRVLVDSGEGLPVRIHRAAFGTTMRPAELPGQLDIFGGER